MLSVDYGLYVFVQQKYEQKYIGATENCENNKRIEEHCYTKIIRKKIIEFLCRTVDLEIFDFA